MISTERVQSGEKVRNKQWFMRDGGAKKSGEYNLDIF